MRPVPFSVLDLAPIRQGGDASLALRNARDLARHAERWGYRRYWLAEHHNMPGIASAATVVAIGYVAEATSTIRVGSGGIMLPNHAPLVVAEQFGTLASLYPGRIDLGLGRAPGTDQVTARALRRDLRGGASFADDVTELLGYLHGTPNDAVRAIPGMGIDVPIWILGSSLYGAELAAALGLPFAFASHFAPGMLEQALRTYRRAFRPSAALRQPYAMAGVPVYAADNDADARRLFSSHVQQFVNLRRGKPTQLPPPADGDIEGALAPWEREMLDEALQWAAVGSAATVRDRLVAFLAHTAVDELMITAQIYDHAARLRSFEIAAEVREALAAEPSPH